MSVGTVPFVCNSLPLCWLVDAPKRPEDWMAMNASFRLLSL